MKKNIIIYTILICTSICSCTKDFNKINADPLGKTDVDASQLMAPTLVSLITTNMLRNRSFNNELMQVTVDISDSEGKVFRYDIRRNWADYTWNNWYVNLTDILDIQRIASKPDKLNKSYQGISLILQSWVFSLITDTYGDVPYQQAIQGWGNSKQGILEPAFDRQKDIYLGLLEKLEQANELLKTGTPIVVSSDPLFNGNVEKWRRLGNSLYLRLLLRISGKAEVSSAVVAKIKDIIDVNPANYPIMENNQHSAYIKWTGSNVSSALYSSPYLANVRANDFYGPAIGEFFMENLSVWNDPRISPAAPYSSSGINRFRIAPGLSGFIGVPSGFTAGNKPEKQSYFYSASSAASKDGLLTLQTDPYTGIIMNCAEVDFILAEVAAKGWIAGSAETYYKKGIADALNYWLPNQFKDGAVDLAVDSYITAADIKWNNTLPLESNAANQVSKMSLIHYQKYYALFLVDFQQWFEYRRYTRTGYPFLPKGIGFANGGVMPARLFYPTIVQSANPVNYKNAVANQGADLISTQVWWQKP